MARAEHTDDQLPPLDVHATLEGKGLVVVGAADPRSDLVGRDLGELLDTGPLGVRVEASADRLSDADGSGRVEHAVRCRVERGDAIVGRAWVPAR